MKKKHLLAAGMMLLLAACGKENNQATTNGDNDTLSVYTTIYPLQYFTERIGGDTVQVESIMPAGADEHTFEPTSKTMMDLAGADAFFYNGLELEPFAEQTAETLSEEQVKTVNVGEQVNIDLIHEHSEENSENAHGHHEEEESHDEHNHGDIDPHIWLEPLLAKQMAETVKEELTNLNPSAQEVYAKNFEALAAELDQLDKQFHDVAEQAKQKEILVSHAAYGYWETSYGIDQISVVGLSSTDEPSQKELQQIADTAKEHNIQYVIFEQNITPKVAKVIQAEIGAESLHLHNLATLTKENIENGENYFSIMSQNLATLKKAMN